MKNRKFAISFWPFSVCTTTSSISKVRQQTFRKIECLVVQLWHYQIARSTASVSIELIYDLLFLMWSSVILSLRVKGSSRSNTVKPRSINDFRFRAKIILLIWKCRALPDSLFPDLVKIKLPSIYVAQVKLVWRKLKIWSEVSKAWRFCEENCWEKIHKREELYKSILTYIVFRKKYNNIYLDAQVFKLRLGSPKNL